MKKILLISKKDSSPYGEELITTSPVTASDWTPYGSNTIADIGTNEVSITYVNNALGAYIYMTSTGICSANLVNGTTYYITCMAKVSAGGTCELQSQVSGTLEKRPLTETYSLIEWTVTQDALTNNDFIRPALMGSGEVVYIKDISVREVL